MKITLIDPQWWQEDAPHLRILPASERTPYGEGSGRHAWALFYNADSYDETPNAIAWTSEAAWARLEAWAIEEEREGQDVDLCPCLLIDGHVVWANDYYVKTHEDLEAAFAAALPELVALGVVEEST